MLALLVLSGCAPADAATRIEGFSYRVDGGQTGTTEDLDTIDVNASSRSLEVWFDLPPLPRCMDPVLLVEQTSTLNQLKIGSRNVDVVTRPFGLVPLHADEGGSRAELVFRERLGRREGPVWVGCRSELELYWYSMGLLPFVVGAALLASAGLLALAFAFQRRAVIGWLALLVLAFGVTALSQSPAFRSMLLAPTWPAAWVRAVFAFVQMIATAQILIHLFGDTRREVFRRLARVMTLTLLVAVVLDVTKVDSLLRWVAIPTLLWLFVLPVALFHVFTRARAGDRAAKRFLWGAAVVALCVTPDILWGLGLPFHFALNVSPLGYLALAAALGAVLDSRFEERAQALVEANRALSTRIAEVEQKSREVATLNTELRHQIGERSRELGRLLSSTNVPESAQRKMRAAPGETLGRYRVVKPLGQGAMGVVYEVERSTDGQPFALKLMAVESPALRARFAREAEVAAKVSHPHVVAIADVGVLESGTPFLVMELVRGTNLEEERARFADVAWALDVLGQAASGLEALHAHGVVHRDLKPANVLVSRNEAGDSTAKLADFGIARVHEMVEDVTLDGDPRPVDPEAATRLPDTKRSRLAGPALTEVGAIIGTPLYMAPELGRGAAATPMSDVFAFGVMAFELLTGRHPFRVSPALVALAGAPFPARAELPDALPAEVREVIERALDPEPERRPSSRMLALTFAHARANAGA